ncbi:MAG TPA: nitrate- and nitrite sensing domain-containing protein [Trebonia sp.]|nr:nitrate- and nitrite sensing domain-containing protein [Trebonia sp.]
MNLSNWPVSRRLFAVIVLALVMGLVFGGLRIASAESSASQFGRVSQLATLGQRLTVLIQDLQDERDETLSNLASSQAAPLAPFYARTNVAVAAVQSATAGIGSGFPVNIQNGVATVNADITGPRLKNLHNTLNPQTPQDELAVIANYGAVISDMINLGDQVAQGVSDASLTSDVRAFNALALAKEQLSQQRALLNYSFSNPGSASPSNVFVDPNTELALQIASQEEFSDESAFQQAATPAERAFLASTLSSGTAATSVAAAQNIETNVIANEGSVTGQSGSPLGLSILGAEDSTSTTVDAAVVTRGETAWDAGMTSDLNALESTETLVADNIASRASQLESGVKQSALITGIITAVVLLLVLAAALLVARSLVLPLRRLRAGALDVASVQLPDRVRQLSESPDPAATLEVSPIDVLTEDEIGQVARAFDQVHQEAVRLAGEEALLRTSFNAMFVNLSRRSQSLIERLARMIDSLEQNEDDPERLANLFSMDHLVTRMRRNSENLLLLAGHEGARKWSESVTLADVARAATSEIEQYNRVVLNIQPGVSVIGQAVSDVVHLLAELVENATLYSPKDTQVQVAAQELTSGGVLIEVTDRGIGVSEARLAEMNWRLDNPPTMDVSVSRHMGLFAVARLAERHRVRVRLRPAAPQGLTALVWLPDSVLERTSRTYTATGGWQQQQPAVQSGFQARRTPGGYGIGNGIGNGNGNGKQAVSQPGYGRHSLGMRAVSDEPAVSERADDIVVPPGPGGHDGASLAGAPQQTVPASNWFRSRRTSASGGVTGGAAHGGTAGGGTGAMPTRTPGSAFGGNGGTGGSLSSGGFGNTNAGARPFVGSPGQASAGLGAPGGTGTGAIPAMGGSLGGGTDSWGITQNPGELAADPVHGEETSAGLPMRVPKANLIPGSAAGAQPGAGTGRTAARPGSTQESQTLSAPLPQRSPELARSRLSGFQRGARRAEGQTPRAGEGTDR